MECQRQKLTEFTMYAKQCYGEARVPLPKGCDTFVASVLPYTLNLNASCPFANEMCKSTTGNLLLDSGDLNSLDHLGLNLGPRFLLRHQTHCAPLNTQNFTEIHTDAQDPSERFMRYKYGSVDNRNFLYQVELKAENLKFNDETISDYKLM
jgi:hypothetical protein